MNGISVIVPVFNGGDALGRCLEAVSASSAPVLEIIVVDDGSTDRSADIAGQTRGVSVLKQQARTGPAQARNRGAEAAAGDILFFLDADVVLHSDCIEKAARQLEADPDLAAVFGSYDDQPEHSALVSRFRNLYHHWIHQQSSPDSGSFWAGCGAIRRDIFLDLGGFDTGYASASIEDIELGSRLAQAGFKVRLDKTLQCTHLKRWTLAGMIHADVIRRGVPWVRLLIQKRQMPNDLNLTFGARFATGSTSLMWLCLLLLVLTGHGAAALPAVALLIGLILCGLLARLSLDSMAQWLLAGVLVLLPVAVAIYPEPGWAWFLPLSLLVATAISQFSFLRFMNRLHGPLCALGAVPLVLVFFSSCALSVLIGAVSTPWSAAAGQSVR